MWRGKTGPKPDLRFIFFGLFIRSRWSSVKQLSVIDGNRLQLVSPGSGGLFY